MRAHFFSSLVVVVVVPTIATLEKHNKPVSLCSAAAACCLLLPAMLLPSSVLAVHIQTRTHIVDSYTSAGFPHSGSAIESARFRERAVRA